MIETRLLKYFLAVAREENITRAAGSLYISQSTLSKQMMDLEAQLGKTLFIRGKKNIALTDDGRYLRARAQEIIQLLEQTETTLRSEDAIISGDVYLGCGETVAMDAITRVFKAIRREHPQVRFHLYSGAADSVLNRLDKGLLDVGLLIDPTWHDQYDYIPLRHSDRFGLLMRRDDPLTQQTVIPSAMLETLPLIVPNQQHIGTTELTRQDNVVATYELIYNATFMVEQGMGYALALEGLVDTAGARDLAFRPIDPETSLASYLVTKKYQTFSPAAKLFLQRVVQEVNGR